VSRVERVGNLDCQSEIRPLSWVLWDCSTLDIVNALGARWRAFAQTLLESFRNGAFANPPSQHPLLSFLAFNASPVESIQSDMKKAELRRRLWFLGATAVGFMKDDKGGAT